MPDIKSFPFPVLSPGSVDYDDGIEYSADTARMRDGNVVQVSHKLVGDSLVSRLVREGAATFACVVSLPSTMYRRIFVADSQTPECSQTVDYSESGYGDDTDAVESPMFRPIILVTRDISQAAGQGAGLGALWADSAIEIPEGAIIAFDEWSRFGGEHGGLFLVDKVATMNNGQMQVFPDNAAGFRFRISVGGDLYDRLKFPAQGQEWHRRSVFTHALSVGFRILKEQYGEDWNGYQNLCIVAQTLEQEGIPHWGSDEFSPDLAATTLYPHIFDSMPEITDDDND